MQQEFAVAVLAVIAFFFNFFLVAPASACPSPAAGKAQPEFNPTTPQRGV